MREQGRVKWFNTKAGYGFVTLLGVDGGVPRGVEGGVPRGDEGGVAREVFVHQTGLRVGKEQFRYLVEGEYVELEVKETDGKGDRKYHGIEVRGIRGGYLMCETRNEGIKTRSIRESNKEKVNKGVEKKKVSDRGHRPSAEFV